MLCLSDKLPYTVQEFLNLTIHNWEFFERLQFTDIDQLILALMFRFGVILVQNIGRKV